MNQIKQILALTLAAIVVIWALSSGARAQGVPTLKSEAIVQGDLVKIGDILDNAGSFAAIPIFRAPELGANGTIQTHRVIEALRSQGMLVFDTKGLSEVLVTRASRSVSLNDLGRAVAEAAVKRYELSSAQDISVTFDNHMKALNVEPNLTEAPRVFNIVFDPNSNRFEALVDMPGSLHLRRNPVRLTGTLVETVEVVTIARAINRGETIRESDLVVERVARAQVGSDALTRIELVANQAARKSLRTGQTVRAADLMKPQIVNRDDTVTIVFRTGGVVLTARGKAQSNGTEGEMISVLNPQSKRVIQATVTGPGIVTVGDINPINTAAINGNR